MVVELGEYQPKEHQKVSLKVKEHTLEEKVVNTFVTQSMNM